MYSRINFMVSDEKKKLAKLLGEFIRRAKYELQVNTDLELSEIMDIPSPQLSRWKSTSTESMPGGVYATRLVNFFIDYVGEDALQLYDLMGWDRPKYPKAADTREGTS